ncbi:MAG: hypothetical protein COA42_16315 [Alteromonadaceae bacterium]|nr:MAG: hypothetical protein COA42_16315 [Alteromonadaceae bacterium]
MNDLSPTATRILDVAQDLIQKSGYNAISFNHIAEGVGIKKPSIVHHFPNKAALGRAVVVRYRETFTVALDSVQADPTKNALDVLALYFKPYTDIANTREKICLCGALAGEFMALPEEMKEEVASFFKQHLQWLRSILQAGKDDGVLGFCGPADAMAKLIFDALQGGLIVARATDEDGHLNGVIDELIKNIRPA